MAKISGWVYLIVGIVMIVFSVLVNNNTGKDSMNLFIFAGIIFVVIGFGKIGWKFFMREKKPKKHKQEKHSEKQVHHHKQTSHHSSNQNTHQHSSHHHSQNPVHSQREIISCPFCSTRHYKGANFCMNCGRRIS
jgi:ABC-type nickel/cobalt efflux system permease component RcnA